jgi:hypothetical protein
MNKNWASALSIARKIAVTPAHARRLNRPKPVPTIRIPRIRWTQPHAVVSRSNV